MPGTQIGESSPRTVYYFARMLPAYRIPLLELLDVRLGGRLVVCHGERPRGSPLLMGDDNTGFRRVHLQNYWWKGETLHAQPFSGVFARNGTPDVVIAEESPRSVTLPFLLRTARKLGAARILWGMFHSLNRPLSTLNFSQRYRLRMAQQVDACICYTRRSRDLLLTHVEASRLFIAQNTVDTRGMFALHDALDREGKSFVRRRLGLPDRPTFVFVGQLIPTKGTQDLLTFFGDFRRRHQATLLIIGEGPERASMEARAAKTEGCGDIQFLGPIPDSEAAPYIYASDVMVIPGYVGLVINHAFCFGVPLLTQEAPGPSPFHAPEIESLVPGKNGLIVQRADGALVEGALNILGNHGEYSRNAFTYARDNLTVDRLLDSVEAAIDFARDAVRDAS